MLDEAFGKIVTKPEFFSKISNEARKTLLNQTGRTAEETIKKSIVDNFGIPMKKLLRYVNTWTGLCVVAVACQWVVFTSTRLFIIFFHLHHCTKYTYSPFCPSAFSRRNILATASPVMYPAVLATGPCLMSMLMG